MGYWTYYLAFLVLAYVTQYPWLLVGIVVFFVARRFVPDPFVILRTFGRIRKLKQQIQMNPSNVTARRDLAEIYLARLRPRAALKLLDGARERFPDDAELLYLTGLARLRAGDAAGALEPIVKAVAIEPRVSFGEPFLVAGDALAKLGRYEEAEDSLERYVEANSSSVQGFTKLAFVRKRRQDQDGARRALREALDTWSAVPGYKKRKELGWWLRAQLARVWI